MKSGIELIKEERQRQIEVEGWTAAHDSKHDMGQLAYAAVTYALPDFTISFQFKGVKIGIDPMFHWPFEKQWLKRGTRKQDLIKAGALIAAEIDRLQNL